jgi:hypothetical protein
LKANFQAIALARLSVKSWLEIYSHLQIDLLNGVISSKIVVFAIERFYLIHNKFLLPIAYCLISPNSS